MNRFTDPARVRSHARSILKSIHHEEWGGIASGMEAHFLKTILPSLCSIPFSDRHSIFGLYRALPGEIDTDAWAFKLSQLGFRLAYPRVDSASACGVRYHLLPTDDPRRVNWSLGAYGVREPQVRWAEIAPSSMRAVLVPGLAFGRGGERVGKGGGYFDRFLSHAASPLRIGICPEKLLFEELPLRPWDQRMDIILTEAGAWDVPRREFLKSGVAPRNQLR